LGKDKKRFGEFFRYLWLSSFQEGKFRIAVTSGKTWTAITDYGKMNHC
jgi:hypothetical protein